MILRTELGKDSYDVVISRGALDKAGELLDLDRKTLVVTDSGVPRAYSEKVATAAKDAHIVTFPMGEKSKSLSVWQTLLSEMLERSFTRRDCVVAVGGGVVGDLAGFAAASYMRGIDFYNVPTTSLSQVDSSVGGKTAVDFCGVKNIVGAFHQPKKVLIDPSVLSTLDKRQFSNGLAEALKMAATFDRDFFALFEKEMTDEVTEEIIARAIKAKKYVVEQDEKEKGLRRALNFGHTVGHGIESVYGDRFFHGECVSLGMLPMCSERAEKRIRASLERLGLPTKFEYDIDRVFEAVSHDKKGEGDSVNAVFVDEIGSHRIEKITYGALKKRVENYLERGV